MKICRYCGEQFEEKTPGQAFCNTNHAMLFKEKGPIFRQDPVSGFLSSLQFSSDVLTELIKAGKDPDLFAKYFNTSPDYFILLNAVMIIEYHDPNRNIEKLGYQDSVAFSNLLRWFIVKYATDPQWTSYIGWMIRFFSTHLHPSAYYPIKYSDIFLPNYFCKKGEPLNLTEERAKVRDIKEAFAWTPPNSEPKENQE